MTSIIYVGMDVHKESYSLCCYSMETQTFFSECTLPAVPKNIVAYLKRVATRQDHPCEFRCGYEAGSLGFSLYSFLHEADISCVIMAPTTILRNGKKVKTDRLDAQQLAQALAFGGYRAVHIPTEEDGQVREYIRMRGFYKEQLKKTKQVITSFCLRHGLVYSGTKKYWTAVHRNWLQHLQLPGLLQETLEEYISAYDSLMQKLERVEQRIEEVAHQDSYQESVGHLCCFRGIATMTAMTTLVEIGDFHRFATAKQFTAYLGLVPGESSSGGSIRRLSLTKAGNRIVRTVLIEAVQSYTRGKVCIKSKAVRARQKGQPAEIIGYADKATHRLMKRWYTMQARGVSHNVAKAAIARELACFIWGMQTGRIGLQ